MGVGWSGTSAALTEAAAAAGSTVIAVRGRVSDRGMELAALDQVLGDAGTDIRSATRALTQLLEGSDAVLAVDDAHWLDPATLDVLARIVDRGLTVWVAHRPVRGNVHLDQLDEALLRHGTTVEMGPLTLDDLAPVVASELGRPAPTDLVGQVWTATSGLPGLARLLLRGWIREGWTERGAPPSVPSLVIEAVRRRLAESGDTPTRLAEMTGRRSSLPVEALSRALGVEGAEVAAAWDLLGSSGLAVPGREQLVEVVVEAVERMILPSARATHDEVLGRALVETGGSAATAVGLLAATGAPVPPVVRIRAAGELRHSDPVAALEHLSAVGATGDPDLDRELAYLRAELGLVAGDGEAGRWITDLADRTPGADLLRAALAVRDARWSRALSVLAAEDQGSEPGGDRVAALALAHLANGREVRLAELETGESVLLGPVALALALAGRLRLDRLLEAAEAAERATGLVVLDTVHAVGSLLCSAAGELGGATMLATRGTRSGVGGPGLARRHHLTRSWAAMRAGRWDEAGVPAEPVSPWATDTMLEAALVAGLARRSGDISRIRDSWDRVEETIVRGTVDLFALEPLTELAIAAHRLGYAERAAPIFGRLGDLVSAMGSPPLWTAVLAWRRLEAAVAASDDESVHREAELLAELEGEVHPLPALAAGARSWSAVISGRVEGEEVVAGAEALAGAGRSWEGSRLMGRAALVTGDPEMARRLLDAARRMCAATGTEEEASAGLERLGLSEREAEVAALVAEGHTYKAIGGRLFISPKTVEHHVASIRSKLGVGTRAEMLSVLRAAADGTAPSR